MASSYETRLSFIISVAFGPLGGATHVCVIERLSVVVEDVAGPTISIVKHVDVWNDASIERQIEWLSQLKGALPRSPISIITDLTHVGKPARTAMRNAGLRAYNIVIGNGASESSDGDANVTVPATNLASALAYALDYSRLRIAKEIANAAALGAELSAARDGVADGFAMPVAMAVWWAERPGSVALIPNFISRVSTQR